MKLGTWQTDNTMNKTENYATQLLWTLLTSCKTIEYAVKELNHTMPEKYNHKGDFIRLDKAIQAYIRVFQGRVTKAESKLFEGIVLDNVALVTEAVAIMSMIPNSQIDWMSDQLFNLAKEAVNRANDELLG